MAVMLTASLRAAAWLFLAVPALAQPVATQAPPAVATEAVVMASVENLYSAPDASKDVVTQAFVGQVVQELEAREGFVRVRTPDAYEGWIAARALHRYPANEPRRYARGTSTLEVTSLMANVYREPDVTTARPLLQAPLGARLELAQPASAERFQAVRLPDGTTGYVQIGDVRLIPADRTTPMGTGEDVVRTARRFMGVPYLWGGLSPHGVDCSGLVSRAYAVNGIVVPRDAHLQQDDPRAKRVSKDDLKPGDLLFFGKTKTTHVGIWAGNGVFVHATTHERPVVQESRLDDPHWTALFRGAVRPPRADR
jgi:cell wall-associated NlpC family hydrolase